MPSPIQGHLRPGFLPPPRPNTKITHYAAGREIVSVVDLDFTFATANNAQLRFGASVFRLLPGSPFTAVFKLAAFELRLQHADAAAQSTTTNYGLGSTMASGAGNTITGTTVNVIASASTTSLNGQLTERQVQPASPFKTSEVFLNFAGTWPAVANTQLRVRGKLTLEWLALGPQ